MGYLGRIITIIGIAMLSCIAWSIYYQEDVVINLGVAAGITISCGILLGWFFPQKASLNFKESFAVVSLGWICASLFGSLPYMLTGYLPSFADAVFETVSGFTTTGASVITDVETIPKGLLFWRSLTQWLGGMGIIALFVAIIAGMGAKGNQLFRAEVPGPITDKVSPRIRDSAKKLWKTYVVLSIILCVLLYVFGMNLFDAFCHTFTTMATGGFSTKNNSVAYYTSPAIQWTLVIFMFIAGVNFSLHFLAYKKRSLKLYLRDREFKVYSSIALVAIFIVFISWATGSGMNIEEKLRGAAFQVVSIMTTTGFATMDYDRWPALGQAILFLLMLVGGCAGSTGGSVKPGRYLIIFQRGLIELKQMVHPKAILPQKFGGKVLGDALVINVLQFFFLYVVLIMIGALVMALMGLDLFSSLTASMACLGNIGPGFGLVGPTLNYGFIADGGKYLLSVLMLVGRLEIYPVLVILMSQFWQE